MQSSLICTNTRRIERNCLWAFPLWLSSLSMFLWIMTINRLFLILIRNPQCLLLFRKEDIINLLQLSIEVKSIDRRDQSKRFHPFLNRFQRIWICVETPSLLVVILREWGLITTWEQLILQALLIPARYVSRLLGLRKTRPISLSWFHQRTG